MSNIGLGDSENKLKDGVFADFNMQQDEELKSPPVRSKIPTVVPPTAACTDQAHLDPFENHTDHQTFKEDKSDFSPFDPNVDTGDINALDSEIIPTSNPFESASNNPWENVGPDSFVDFSGTDDKFDPFASDDAFSFTDKPAISEPATTEEQDFHANYKSELDELDPFNDSWFNSFKNVKKFDTSNSNSDNHREKTVGENTEAVDDVQTEASSDVTDREVKDNKKLEGAIVQSENQFDPFFVSGNTIMEHEAEPVTIAETVSKSTDNELPMPERDAFKPLGTHSGDSTLENKAEPDLDLIPVSCSGESEVPNLGGIVEPPDSVSDCTSLKDRKEFSVDSEPISSITENTEASDSDDIEPPSCPAPTLPPDALGIMATVSPPTMPPRKTVPPAVPKRRLSSNAAPPPLPVRQVLSSNQCGEPKVTDTQDTVSNTGSYEGFPAPPSLPPPSIPPPSISATEVPSQIMSPPSLPPRVPNRANN